MKTKPLSFFHVRYAYEVHGQRLIHHSVASGHNQRDAEARFARENPHVRVLARPDPQTTLAIV